MKNQAEPKKILAHAKNTSLCLVQCGCYISADAISVVYIPKSHKSWPSSKHQAKTKSWACWQEAGMLDTQAPGVEKPKPKPELGLQYKLSATHAVLHRPGQWECCRGNYFPPVERRFNAPLS